MAVKKAKKTTGGNGKPDQAWFEAVMAAGELHAPDESQRPAGFIYDIHYQWEATAEELNIDFFESFRRASKEYRACNGTSFVRDGSGMYIVDRDWERLRRPCLARPMRGGVVCQTHGGLIPQVREAARRVLEQASEVVAIRLVGLTDTEDENGTAIEHKNRITAANSVLDRAGIKGGTEVEIKAPGVENVINRLFTDDSNGQ